MRQHLDVGDQARVDSYTASKCDNSDMLWFACITSTARNGRKHSDSKLAAGLRDTAALRFNSSTANSAQ
jgi:hypothetical protein